MLGKVAFISVGAHMVASIEFTIAVGEKGSKGDDYGFFKFGGSTVVCVWEKVCVCVCVCSPSGACVGRRTRTPEDTHTHT